MATITGSSGADTLTGTDQADFIDPGAGDDVVHGGAGNDTIVPGAFVFPGSHELLYGEAGDDYITIAVADGSKTDPWSLADGGDGFDTAELLFSNFGSALHYTHNAISADITCGRLAGRLVGIEAIFFRAGLVADTITGGDFNDTIYGDGGDDVLGGGAGNDILRGDAGNDVLTGGAGADTFVYALTTWGADTITDFDVSQDRLDVSALSIPDMLVARYYLGQNGGTASFAAGIGGTNQTVTLSGVALAQLTAANFAFSTSTSAFNVAGGSANDFLVGQQGADTFTGGAGDDVLMGAGGVDSLVGGTGQDTIGGGAGNDRLDGGAGIDRAVYLATRAGATIAPGAGNTLVVTTAQDGADTTVRVEQFQFADGTYSFQFADPGGGVLANFAPGAGGWASQTLYPRHLADVNGDHFVDIVGFGAAGVLVSYGSAAGTFSGAGLVVGNFGQASGWSSDNAFHRELADLNGDGRADIIGFGYAGTLVSLAKADGTFDNPAVTLGDFGQNQGWTSQNGFARAVGDVNGDGKADLVGFGYAGTLVALGTGTGGFAAPILAIANFGVAQGWSSDDATHRAVADVNGDGKADIVGFGQAGTWVALAKGDGTFAAAQMVLADFGQATGWASHDSFARLLADVNHDGSADIVGFGLAGTWIAFARGDGTFSTASFDLANFGQASGWSSDGTYHRELADIDNDGLADIVGFGNAGVYVALNQGDFTL